MPTCSRMSNIQLTSDNVLSLVCLNKISLAQGYMLVSGREDYRFLKLSFYSIRSPITSTLQDLVRLTKKYKPTKRSVGEFEFGMTSR